LFMTSNAWHDASAKTFLRLFCTAGDSVAI